jgi:hypothetical protein
VSSEAYLFSFFRTFHLFLFLFPPCLALHHITFINRIPLHPLPPTHTHIEAQRLAQEAFAGLERGLVGFELVAAEDGGDDEGEFHLVIGRSAFGVLLLIESVSITYLCDVAADARAGAVGEGDESASLPESKRFVSCMVSAVD